MQEGELDQFDPNTFEQFANELALEVLGPGLTGFSAGADGGRDGWFEGRAPYPSPVECWDGIWYLQSKFHAPNLSRDPQKWLIDQVKQEIAAFQKSSSRRQWPANWIVVTNIDASGVPETGAFDQCRKIVRAANAALGSRFHIWGGKKVLAFAGKYQHVADRYAHLLTSGHVIAELYATLTTDRASLSKVLEAVVARGLAEQRYTKLDQAGSLEDRTSGIHQAYVDLPYKCLRHDSEGLVLAALCASAACNHRPLDARARSFPRDTWVQSPRRAKIWFVRGGPGQGKSTIGQFFCQIQRAALLLSLHLDRADLDELAHSVKERAERQGFWPIAPRVPVYVELKKYSQWFGKRGTFEARGVETYVAEVLSGQTQLTVTVGSLREMLRVGRWAFIFDGLDEVPSPIKDQLAEEIREFVHGTAQQADLLTVCTSRPQGYSGQFDSLSGADLRLTPLPKPIAFECARLVASMGRSEAEAESSTEILDKAIRSDAVGELMTTPLQAHIIAVIVRSGQHPPERKWELYRRFYDVIVARERAKFSDGTSDLLRREGILIRTVHNRLGFVLHSDAEVADGSLASLPKSAFRDLVSAVVREKKGEIIPELTERIMTATTDRLVLINTPEDGSSVRFDIRQIQEFFAAEFLHDGATPDELAKRVITLGADAHWREVMHFMFSALAEGNRKADLSVVLKVLEEVDDSHTMPEERTLARALARGAVVSVGLIRDGVLEQDRGVRNLFWKSLEPLVGVRDARGVEPLLGVEGDASKRWLCDLMLAEFEQRLWHQALGAFRVLWELLKDGDPSIARVRQKVMDSGYAPVAHALRRVAFNDSRPPAQQWQAELIVDSLTGPDSEWWSFAAALRSAEVARVVTDEVVRRYGPPWSILVGIYRGSRSGAPRKKERFGPFTLRAEGEEDGPEPPAVTPNLPVALRIIASGLKYARSLSQADFVEMLTLLNGSWDRMYILPWWVIPNGVNRKHSPNELRAIIKAMDRKEFDEGKWKRQHVSAPFRGDPDSTEIGIRQLAKVLPAAVPSVLSFLSDSDFQHQGILDALILSMAEDTEALATIDPRLWGYLVPERAREALRRTGDSEAYRYANEFRDTSPRDFHLRLPEDTVLLPRVLASLLDMKRSHAAAQGRVSETLARYALDPNVLAPVAKGTHQGGTPQQRVAAVLLTMLCPGAAIDDIVREHAVFLQDAAVQGNLLVHQIGNCGFVANCLESREFRSLVSSILRDIQNNLVVTTNWETTIADWRERSSAPSLTSGARDGWCT